MKKSHGLKQIGRPPSENPKSYTISVRVDEAEFLAIESICGRTGLTKAKLLRGLFKMVAGHDEWFEICED